MMRKFSTSSWLFVVAVMMSLVSVSQADNVQVAICTDGNNPVGNANCSIFGSASGLVNSPVVSPAAGVNVTATGRTAPFAGPSTLSGETVVLENTNASAVNLWVWVSANNETPNPPNFGISLTNNTQGNASATLTAYQSNIPGNFFQQTNQLGGPLTLSGLGATAEGANSFGVSNPYELTERLAITLGANSTADFTALIQPTPEPASMLLFGTGLSGVAALLRRRGKK